MRALLLGFVILLRLQALSDTSFTLSDTVEVHKLEDVTDSFQSVSLLNSYNSPVIVCVQDLPSSSEPEAAIRLDNVHGSGFDIRIQKPINDPHVATDVQCMVAEEGVNTLVEDDGEKYQFEAHTVLSTQTSGATPGWAGTAENVTGQLQLDHGDNPSVIGQVMSYNDEYFSLFWTYNCSSNAGTPPTSSAICVGKHIGQTTTSSPQRKTETLGYIVIESDLDGDGSADGDDTISVHDTSTFPPTWRETHYRVELGGDSIRGVDDGGGTYDVGYDYRMGVATQSAMDGGDGSWAVFFGNDPFEGDSLDLAVDEDTTDGTDRSHTTEQVAYWIFDQNPGLDWMEVQKFSNIGGDWTSVSFLNSYDTAVPVCTYNLPSADDNEAVVRIRNITQSGMEIRLERPKNSSDVTAGDVYCIVMEEGNNTFDGRNVEAYRVDSDDTNGKRIDWDSDRMEHVNYQLDYNKPAVLGQVISNNDENWSVFWSSNGSQGGPPDSSNLYVGKHIGKETPKYRKDEVIGYIIGAPHEGEVNHVHYALARGGDSVQGVGNNPPYNYDLTGYEHPHYSYAVASQNAMDGYQGGWAVLYGNDPVGSVLSLAIDEETVEGDTTRAHTTEQVSYWVFELMPYMSLSKVSCVLDDPVNDTTDPKRIPGATIRYVLELNNTGKGAAGDAKVDDNLSAYFDSTTITTPKVFDGRCGDCLTVSGGSDSGSVTGSDVTVDFGTVEANTTKCGYFEVKIQ